MCNDLDLWLAFVGGVLLQLMITTGMDQFFHHRAKKKKAKEAQKVEQNVPSTTKNTGGTHKRYKGT